MPVVQINDTLRNIIKEERKKRGLRGDTLAKDIKKSASYISQVENGSIATMDINVLYALFKRIIDLPQEDLPDYLHKITENNIKFTQDDIRKKEWLLNLEYQFRLFPIVPEIIDFLKAKLKELNIASKDLVLKINKNDDLNDDLLAKLEDNKVWVKMDEDGEIQTAIKFLLNEDYIEKILKREVKSINKINMEGILYNIYKLEGMNTFDSNLKANEKLKDFKFYTLEERDEIIEKAQLEKKDLSTVILKEDNECNSYINKIIKHFVTLRDINCMYGIDVFSSFNKSLTLNKKLMYGLLKVDFSKLKDISDDRKKDFINDVEQLITKYSEPDKNDFIL